MAKMLMTPRAQLEERVARGLIHCVDGGFHCKGCPYEELESGEYPLRCVYQLLTDIQNLRAGNIPPLEASAYIEN
jgi:hypothetical protein